MTPPHTRATAMFLVPTLRSGGAERHAVDLACSLDPERFRTVVATWQDGPYRGQLQEAGVEVLTGPGNGPRDTMVAARWLSGVLEDRQVAVLTSQHFSVDVFARAALISRRARRVRPIPYVVWKHTYGHVGYRGAREVVAERTTGHLVSWYGAVCFTQVNYLRNQLMLPSDRIKVLQNSIPLEIDQSIPRDVEDPLIPLDGGPLVLTVGNLRADKGFADLLHAWRSVRVNRPDATLAIVGDGVERVALEALAQDAGNVVFLGSRPDAARLVARASLLVLASYNIECFPYVVLEAMRASVPVVATATGGLAELVDHGVTGTLVPPRDPAALADAVLEALAAEESGADRGRAGRRRLETNFPFDRWRARVNDLYWETV